MLHLLRAAVRFRRTAALLFAVLLAHTSWMAGSPACESRAPHQAQAPQTLQSPAPAHVHQQAHAPAPAPAREAPTTTLACPMAMACAVTAVLTDVPSFETVTVAVSRTVSHAGSDMPRSSRVAPETPPPRG